MNYSFKFIRLQNFFSELKIGNQVSNKNTLYKVLIMTYFYGELVSSKLNKY